MSTNEDYAILNEFHFDITPVGIKYLVREPEGIPALNQKIALCEMLKKAQSGDAFYATVSNHTCEAGQYILGQRDIEDQFVSGEFGAGLGLFKEPRAAGRLYHYIPKIAKGVVNHIALAPLEKLPFDPDVVIIIASIDQAEIILRATSYETGQMWSSKYSPAIGCAWLFAYPYLTGEVNFITTGLGFGMRRRKLFPQGQQFIALPFDCLPSLMKTLKEMPWVPEPFKPHGLEFVADLRKRLCLE
ncbi:MAG TPA: DUF169 domain-containing protein [Syntrophorhabdaceae bacterium]|nr:DUF169 domain-containing protein [Syntrophorhabdaceae bacterium]